MDLDLPDSYQAFYESFPTHGEARQMSVDEVVAARKAGKQVVFVDARMKEEQDTSVIPGALELVVEKNPFELTVDDCVDLLGSLDAQLDGVGEDAVVVSYCTAGLRGGLCALALEKKLGRPAHNLTGGLIEWKNVGQDVKTRDGGATEEVHPCLPPLAKYLK